MCKIQKREYSIYRRVYFEMKGGWIMSEKKLRNITDVLCFLMILGYVMYLVATWGNLPERVPIHFNAHGSRTGMERRAAFFWSRFWGC